MSRTEFISNLIFYIFRDKSFNDTYLLKNIFKDLLGCEYEDEIVNNCFIKIINYQIDKYGCSLYSRDNIVRHR